MSLKSFWVPNDTTSTQIRTKYVSEAKGIRKAPSWESGYPARRKIIKLDWARRTKDIIGNNVLSTLICP
jgi:hypothetical protein